jgi:WD repeat and SOF domain-containing protein 1
MDVDYSPTGREFVAGSYDHSVRVFAYNGGHSRDVYHTKRMQRVFCVRFSGDGSYVFSGSDDMNVRVWKAEASAQMGVRLPREKHKQAYQTALVNRYKHLPEIKRIVRHRRVPTGIYKVGPLALVLPLPWLIRPQHAQHEATAEVNMYACPVLPGVSLCVPPTLLFP